MKSAGLWMIPAFICAICVSVLAAETVKKDGTLSIDGGTVLPNTKYRLTFTGTVNGPDVIGKNPEVEKRFFSEAGAKDVPMASWQLRFKDKDGNIQLGGIKQDFYQKLVLDGRQVYTQDFYAPHFADKLEVRFMNPSSNSVSVESVKVEPLKEDFVNLNPGLNLGKYNFSGYGRATQSRMKTDEDGKSFLSIEPTRYGMVVTDTIPVTPGKNYRLSMVRHGETKENIGVYVRFLDKSFRLIGDEGLFHKWGFTFYSTWKNDQKSFKDYTAPENAAYMECLIANGDIEKFMIAEVVPKQ